MVSAGYGVRRQILGLLWLWYPPAMKSSGGYGKRKRVGIRRIWSPAADPGAYVAAVSAGNEVKRRIREEEASRYPPAMK